MTEPRVAKSDVVEQPIQHKPIENTLGITTVQYDDVPIDIYRFFDLPMEATDSLAKKELRDIASWAFYDVETLGDGLKKLRSLEIKLGTPIAGERRHSKLWNWITVEKQIMDMRKKQEALSG